MDVYSVVAVDELHQHEQGLLPHQFEALLLRLEVDMGPTATGVVVSKLHKRMQLTRGLHGQRLPPEYLSGISTSSQKANLLRVLPVIGIGLLPDGVLQLFASGCFVAALSALCFYAAYGFPRSVCTPLPFS